MGADRVVVHPGAIQKRTRQAALATARQCFRTLRHRCDEEGYQDILLCPETMGKINQLGDLEEVLTLCTEAEGLLPCVDFGHLYARSLGALDGPEAVERMLDQMVRELGVARASQFHSHFSKIAYTPRGGEARHLTFDQPDFGPDPAPLCEALARRGWSPRVICESAGTQDVDALDEGGLSPGLGGDGGGLRREKSKENPQESPWGGEIPLQKSERYCKIENAYGIKAARFAALPAGLPKGACRGCQPSAGRRYGNFVWRMKNYDFCRRISEWRYL